MTSLCTFPHEAMTLLKLYSTCDCIELMQPACHQVKLMHSISQHSG
jgi:hypothetical protein